jgi:hypothetical protein
MTRARVLFFAITVMMLLTSLCACRVTAPGPSHAVPYRVLNNYFVRNDVPDIVSPRVIFSQADFQQTFGMAAFKGAKGRPTPVNFDEEIVMAVLPPRMQQTCELRVKEVVTEEGKLVFRYECALGAPLSYTIRPSLLIAVPRVAAPHLADDLGGYSFQKVDIVGRE